MTVIQRGADAFPITFACGDEEEKRWYDLEIQKNRPFENRCGQPNYTLRGLVYGFTTDDAVDARQLGAQCWLMDHDAMDPRSDLAASVTFDSDGEVFVAMSDDLEPLVALVTLLREGMDEPPETPKTYDPDGPYTEAWHAMLRREERRPKIVR